METLVIERQPEIAPEHIAEKIHALDWRDLQLWGIGVVVLAVMGGGFVALVMPQMLWHISAAVARQENIAPLILGLTALLILLNVYPFQQRLVLLRTRRQLIVQLQAAEQSARTDAVTGVYNRRFMEEALARETARAERSPARKVVQQMDPSLPLIEPTTQKAQYETTISQRLLFARLAGFFGLLAVVLVATGLYGTLAYRVNNRTVEIGVRMAVGAQRRQVVWMVLRDSLLLTAIGVVIGVPLASLTAKALTSALYGVQPYDSVSYLSAVCGVALVAIVASLLPARRAANVDPLSALRAE